MYYEKSNINVIHDSEGKTQGVFISNLSIYVTYIRKFIHFLFLLSRKTFSKEYWEI